MQIYTNVERQVYTNVANTNVDTQMQIYTNVDTYKL